MVLIIATSGSYLCFGLISLEGQLESRKTKDKTYKSGDSRKLMSIVGPRWDEYGRCRWGEAESGAQGRMYTGCTDLVA